MMTDEEYAKWLRQIVRRKRELVFINQYLRTMDPYLAYQKAGYNYSVKSQGVWKVYTRLFPVIQYKMSKLDLNIEKNFIVSNWLYILSNGDNQSRSTALKQLSKLFGYIDQANSKINIENNIPSQPVIIKFNED